MKKPLRSQYIRVNKQSTLIKRWVARILLQAQLEDYLIFERIEKRILFLFNTKGLTKDNQDDSRFVRAWLKREYASCGEISFDESDVFSINTKNIAKLIGLNRVERRDKLRRKRCVFYQHKKYRKINWTEQGRAFDTALYNTAQQLQGNGVRR